MAEREVSYESLKNRWQREVSTGPQELTRLAPSFYGRVEDYLDELEEEYQREHEIDPTSGKAMLLQDELFNLRKILEDLYEQRERKVLLLALAAARGGDPDRSNMTDGEEALFESVVDALEGGRRRILHRPERDLEEDAQKATTVPDDRSELPEEPLDTYDEADPHPRQADEAPRPPDADGPPGAPSEGTSEAISLDPPTDPPPAPGDEPEPQAEPRTESGAPPEEAAADSGEADGRVVVRVTEGVDAFAASDMRTYDLEAEDVACLPPNAARALVERDKADLLSGQLED